MGGHRVPGSWQFLLPEEARWLQLPAEQWATCDSCPQAALGECRDDVRCCGYFPVLPNFLLGMGLLDPETRESMGAVVDRGHALPVGLVPTPRQLHAAVQVLAEDRVGQDPAVVCPFLQVPEPGCAVHAYRNSICSTFFCEHDHGPQGQAYWDAVQALVGLAETLVSQWAMDQVGLQCDVYFAALDSLSHGVPELAASEAWPGPELKMLWGQWYGRERAFFEACALQVMEHRHELYDIVRDRPLFEARALEGAVLEWMPPNLRPYMPPLSAGKPVPLEALWYRLQLKTRQLWELPLGEGPVVLSPGARLGANPLDDRASRLHPEKSSVITGPDGERLFLTAAEARALQLFEEKGWVLGETLLHRPEMTALEQPRIFLATCMRRGLLVPSQ